MSLKEPPKVCVVIYDDDKLAKDSREAICSVLLCNITNSVALHQAKAAHVFDQHNEHELCVLIETSICTRWFGLVAASYTATITVFYQDKSIRIAYRSKSPFELGARIVGEFTRWVTYSYLGKTPSTLYPVFTYPRDSTFPKPNSTVQV